MASWDAKANKVIRHQPERDKSYPQWIHFDCGCCNGIKWGGESPIECSECWGTSYLCVHTLSGTVALFPGGPLTGWKMERTQINKLIAEVDGASI